MASDNILNALLGVIQGSQQGVDLYLQDSIARRREKQKMQDELSMIPLKAEATAKAEFPYKQALEQSKFNTENFVNNTNELPPSVYPMLGVNANENVHLRKDFIGPTISAYQKEKSGDITLGEKQTQFNQREWDKLMKDNDPNSASSRSVIGIMGRTNLNANRAIATLQKPKVTNQEAGNVMADIASIYQGGAPTQFGMQHQQYQTLYGKLQGVVQMISGDPQDALPQAIKGRLMEVLSDMKNVNTGIITKQLDKVEKTQSNVIKSFPEQWKEFRGSLESDFAPDTSSPFPKEGRKPLGAFYKGGQ